MSHIAHILVIEYTDAMYLHCTPLPCKRFINYVARSLWDISLLNYCLLLLLSLEISLRQSTRQTNSYMHTHTLHHENAVRQTFFFILKQIYMETGMDLFEKIQLLEHILSLSIEI